MLTKRQEQILIDHFKYSVNDISSYDELTDSEKKLMSEEEFNELYKLCKGTK